MRAGWIALGVVVLLVAAARRAGAVVRFKDGVLLALAPDMAKALPAIERAHQAAGVLRGAVVTSGTDGTHSANSLHYVGLAVDLRSNDLVPAQRELLVAMLRRELNGNAAANRPYQVVVEPTHLHVEYQPVPGWRPA